MLVDDALFDRLERLAMVRIPSERRQDFKNDLEEILKNMATLHDIDTDCIRLGGDKSVPLRDDTPESNSVAGQILSQAPNSMEGYFIVPKVIE